MKKKDYLFIVLIIFVHLLPIGLFFGWLAFMVGITSLDEREFRRDVLAFYREAGFQGEVRNMTSELHGWSTEHHYTYQEKVGDKVYEVAFFYSPEDVTGKELRTVAGLAEHYDDPRIEPLLETAFLKSDAFQDLSKTLRQSVDAVGGQVESVILADNYEYDKQVIQEHLQQDLKKAAEEKNDHLRGLTSLNVAEYIGLGLYQVEVVMADTSAKVDVSQLPVEG